MTTTLQGIIEAQGAQKSDEIANIADELQSMKFGEIRRVLHATVRRNKSGDFSLMFAGEWALATPKEITALLIY